MYFKMFVNKNFFSKSSTFPFPYQKSKTENRQTTKPKKLLSERKKKKLKPVSHDSSSTFPLNVSCITRCFMVAAILLAFSLPTATHQSTFSVSSANSHDAKRLSLSSFLHNHLVKGREVGVQKVLGNILK